MLKKLSCLIVILMSACSNYNNAFECTVGKGINCTSVSKINDMVDRGTFNQSTDNASKNNIKKETIKVTNKMPFPLALPNDLHHVAVQRTPDTTLRIWVAPYVSSQDGYIEAQYVHEVLEKSSWVEQRG